MSQTIRRAWTREELILTVELYCLTTFGRINNRNKDIIALAAMLGRTPSSVSYKMANFASIDPTLDRKGASHVSKLDIAVWNEFFQNWNEMFQESEKIRRVILQNRNKTKLDMVFDNKRGKDKYVQTKSRVNQDFFRQVILASFDNCCCITGCSITELLVASHIVPWSVDKQNRLNPCNGLCMNALHDKAFDIGLLTIDQDYRVVVSGWVEKSGLNSFIQETFLKYSGQQIHLPTRFIPDRSFLEYHRTHIFQTS
ncbi:MAG: HNH endonuclease [Candidatus Cloacimonetes bacterium]|nr:HNH endonuclease [Candidatus Cloacimonadota bacterium]